LTAVAAGHPEPLFTNANCRRRHTGIWAGSSKLGLDAEATALDTLRVADTKMVKALRVNSVEAALDPREFALLAFNVIGGSGRCWLSGEIERYLRGAKIAR
jgi:N-methylhydantoinase A/oxoprolinase/acetone carboxylase beta subunit